MGDIQQARERRLALISRRTWRRVQRRPSAGLDRPSVRLMNRADEAYDRGHLIDGSLMPLGCPSAAERTTSRTENGMSGDDAATSPTRTRFGQVQILGVDEIKAARFDIEEFTKGRVEKKLRDAVEAEGGAFDPKALRQETTPYRRDPETRELIETTLLRGDATEIRYRATIVAEVAP